MLPNIDPTTNAVNVGAAAPVPQQVKRAEQGKAAEAYNSTPVPVLPGVRPLEERSRTRDDAGQPGAGGAQRAADSTQTGKPGGVKPKTGSYAKQGADQAEINFQLTREERDAFLNAMSGQEDPADMTEQEQTSLQRASERVQKLIEDAATRRTDRTERLDKAVQEWYSRLSNGKYSAPPNLIQLIQQAAAGNMNFKNTGELVAR